MPQKKEEAKNAEQIACSTHEKKPDGTLEMKPFIELIPQGDLKKEMERYHDLDILHGKLMYNAHFNRSAESEFLKGSYSEKSISFQADPLEIVWGDDTAENEINAYRIINLLVMARYSLQEQKSCEEMPQPAFVITDIHGQFSDLLKWFFKIGTPDQSNVYSFICTGDMVDRGLMQIETVCLFLYYKLRYPSRFLLLRGNHEDFDLHENYGFLSHCNSRFSNHAEERHKYLAKNMWYIFIHVFNYLPTVAIVEKKFMCVHGGISPLLTYCLECKEQNERHKLLEICTKHKTIGSVDKLISIINDRIKTPIQVGNNFVKPINKVMVPESITRIEDPSEYKSMFSDLIWSDPKPCEGETDFKDANWLEIKGWSANSQRDISFLFGTDVIEKFIIQFNLSTIIRGHECKRNGYDWHYMRRCLTVFSAPGYSDNNDAAIAMVTEKVESAGKKLRLDPIVLNGSDG